MAVETQELAVIKSGISSAMAESAGQFRQAATASAASITKVVKDISNIFAAQRRDLADLSNSINEVVHELEQTNSKFDNLERVFEESLSIQTAMRGDMKTMAISMKNMTDGIYQLDKNMQNAMTGPNGLLSGLTAGLTSGFGGVTGKLGELLLKVGAPLAAGAAAGGAIGYTMGGGGSDAGGGSSSGGGGGHYKLTAEQKKEMATAIRQTSKDIGIQPENLAAIMSFETGGTLDPWKAGPVTKYGQHRGLIQWGEPQAREFGVGPETSITDQVKAAGKYLQQRGVKPGMPLENIYSAVIHGNATSGLDVPDKFGTTARSGAANMMRTAHIHALENLEKGTNSKEENKKTNPLNNSDATAVSQNPVTPTSSGGTSPQTEGSVSTSSLEVKGGMHGQAFSGGEVHPGVMALASKIQGSIPGFNRFTAFNDAYHHRVNPGSKHAQGLAADFTLQDPSKSEQAANQIRQMLQSMGISGRVLNEYTNPSAHATGGHIHVQFDSAQEAEKFKSGKATEPSKDQEKSEVATKQESKNVAESLSPTAAAATTSMATAVTATPVTAAAVTPSETPAAPPPPEPVAATPVSQEAVTPAVSAPVSSADTSAMMGMMGGGMLPGGLGGIIEMIGPMLESLLGSLAPSEAYAQQQEQPQTADMLQTLSKSMQATQMINQTAVQTQAQTEQQDMSQFSIPGTAPDAGVNPNQMSYQQAGYSYNYPWDVSWPDWASMIGGNHWSEMRKIKKNMWA